MKKTSLFISLLTTLNLLQADDTYIMKYSKETNCTLTKNGKNIPLFDPKFEKKEPSSSYTCSALQKESYNDCARVNHKNTSAEFLGFGAYEYTNLIIAFKNPHPTVKSSIEVKCTKELK